MRGGGRKEERRRNLGKIGREGETERERKREGD